MFAVEALLKIIDTKNGSKSLLAESLRQEKPGSKICAAHINNWIYRDKKIPPLWVIPLAKVTDYEVTPHELHPELYPYPSDGLPPHMDKASSQSV